MRNRLFTLFLILIISICFISCDGDAGGAAADSNGVEITSISQLIKDATPLKYFKANVDSSTKAIGLAASSSSKGTKSLDSYLNYMIVKVDEGSTNPEPVTFTAARNVTLNGRTIKAGDVIAQSEMAGYVDKVYVLGDYTLVSFLTVDALALVNRIETTVLNNTDSNSYYGSVSLRSDEHEDSGYWEQVSYDYRQSFSEYADSINISYSRNEWYHDSDGKYHEDRVVDKNENLVLRCKYNNVPAFNEYNNVMLYDTFDYYTTDFRQSFIIDNNNGNIYMIPKKESSQTGMHLSVHQGVVIDKTLGPVKLTVNENGELDIDQIVQNPSIYIYDVFRDSYGQYYVCNDSISEIDGNVVFYERPGEYIPTESGKAVHISFEDKEIGTYSEHKPITGLEYVGDNFSSVSVGTDEEIIIDYNLCLNDLEWKFKQHGLFEYNSRNGHDFGQLNSNNSGLEEQVIALKNNVLYTAGRYTYRFVYRKTDFSNNYTQIMNGWSDNDSHYYAVLDGDHVLIASKGDSSSYSLYVVNPFDLHGPYYYYQEYYIADDNSENGYEQVSGFDMFAKDYCEENDYKINWNDFKIGNKYYSYKEGYNYNTVYDLWNVPSDLGDPILIGLSISTWKGSWDGFSMTFEKKSKTGTDSYMVEKDSEGNFSAVLYNSTTAEARRITLQPINR